jgi:hypothetical protein
MSQEVGLRIRLQDALRRDFIETCKSRDTTAAQVLRAFMRAYVDQHGLALKQGKLFDGGTRKQTLSEGDNDGLR